MKRLTAFLALMTMATPALAQDSRMNVQEFLAYCDAVTSSPGRALGSFCLGTITASRDVMQLNCVMIDRGYSSPQGLAMGGASTVTGGAGVQTFVNWARAHPEEWTTDYTFGVSKALTAAFPCAAAQ